MSRKVKFKFVSIPIRYKLGLSLEEVTKCSKPEEIPDSAVRVGLYYVLSNRNEYIEFIHNENGDWIKMYSRSVIDLSIDFNGYHRLLTKKEIDSLNGVKCNQLVRYWRNLRYVQNLNNSDKKYRESLIKGKRRRMNKSSLLHWTCLDIFY